MFTSWVTLTFTAFLAGAATGHSGVSVAPSCRVKGHPEVELTLHCGDGRNSGAVRYWHTPFGELHTPGFHGEVEPVFVQHDGSLVMSNSSSLHSGSYYCLLQHAEGATLWPYELHVGRDRQEGDEREQSGGCATFRMRRDVVAEGEKQGGPSELEFAGAVAASVLLTFVLGFSAGALSRSHVLRCFGAVSVRLRSPRQQTDTVGRSTEVPMATVPPMYQVSEVGRVWDDDSVNSVDTTISSTASCPPAKPQRSFRQKRGTQQDTAAYLGGCGATKEEEQSTEEGGAGRTGEERGGDDSEEGERELLEEDGGKQSKTDEDKCSEEEEEEDGGESREEKRECTEESDEEAGEQPDRSREDEEERREREEEEEAGGNGEKARDERGNEADGWREERGGETEEKDGGSEQLSTDTDSNEDGVTPEAELRSPSRRVIRLYQYDEDGQRYAHLPDPAPDDAAPRPRPRSVSLTRLSTIMAAASAGPGRADKDERPHFHMDL